MSVRCAERKRQYTQKKQGEKEGERRAKGLPLLYPPFLTKAHCLTHRQLTCTPSQPTINPMRRLPSKCCCTVVSVNICLQVTRQRGKHNQVQQSHSRSFVQ